MSRSAAAIEEVACRMADPGFTAEQLAAGEALFRRPWQFLKSVPQLADLPAAERPEICVVGRSNVGKSSLINRLVGRALARTSNTPGRTQELNFYEPPGASLFLVDLPGYGFAEAPKERVEAWSRLVRDYVRGRPRLVRAFLLIDVRRGLTPGDLDIMRRMDEAAVSYQGVLTKIDKVKPTQLQRMAIATQEALLEHPAAAIGLFATSAVTGVGFAELKAQIAALAAAGGSQQRAP
jgi:GTP-binding protein